MGIIVSSALTVAPSNSLSRSVGLAQDYPFWTSPEFTLFFIASLNLSKMQVAYCYSSDNWFICSHRRDNSRAKSFRDRFTWINKRCRCRYLVTVGAQRAKTVPFK